MSTPSPCASCGAPVYWLIHNRTRRPAPIDVEPVEGGNIIVDLECGEYAVDAEVGSRTSHFATCPNAAAHRKP